MNFDDFIRKILKILNFEKKLVKIEAKILNFLFFPKKWYQILIFASDRVRNKFLDTLDMPFVDKWFI